MDRGPGIVMSVGALPNAIGRCQPESSVNEQRKSLTLEAGTAK
jgi:hypothetical protein